MRFRKCPIVSKRSLNHCIMSLLDLNLILRKLDEMNLNIKQNNELIMLRLQKLETAHERENSELRQMVSELRQKIDDLENRDRRNNLVLYGLEERNQETWEQTEGMVMEFLLNHLHLKLDSNEIERAHRIGPKHPGRNRLVIIKLGSYKTRSKILNAAGCLRGSPFRIGEDFSFHVRRARKQLMPFLFRTREAGDKARLNYDKLFINGVAYTIRDGKLQPIYRMTNAEGTDYTEGRKMLGPVGRAYGDGVYTRRIHPSDQDEHLYYPA